MILPNNALCFDDVLLVPLYSSLESRSDANITSGDWVLGCDVPIITANMDTVTGFEMAVAAQDSGAQGILHRFTTPEITCKWIKDAINEYGMHLIPSIGVGEKDYENALMYIECGAKAICVDIAHGHSYAAVEMVRRLVKKSIYVIAGNVATWDGAYALVNAGARAVKVGVGSGSTCQTRIVTGHGIPTLQSILDIAPLKKRGYDFQLIADGGIKNSGDIVKALAAGADLVMVGHLVAGCDECPKVDGKNIYRGMASSQAQLAFKGKVSNSAPEGAAGEVAPKGPVKNVLECLAGGIRSGLSYSGARNLKELRDNAEFVKVSSNCVIENDAHAFNK